MKIQEKILTILMLFAVFGLTACSGTVNTDSPAGAANGPWGTAAKIETTSGNAINPQITYDSSGNAIAVWQQSDGTRDNIWANRYTASAGLWGTAAKIETDDTGTATNPQIAFDPSGNAIAVWQQSDGTRDNIYANRYTASTGLWGTAALIETDNTGAASAPQIAIDPSGNAIVVWQQSNFIWSNRYTASTEVWGTDAKIEIGGSSSNPQIAIDASGNAFAIWRGIDVASYRIYVNRYTAGSGWGGAAFISTNPSAANIADFPQIAFDSSGNAIAVWHQYNSIDSCNNIWWNRYTKIGDSWSGAVKIVPTTTYETRNPQIAINASGIAFVVWEQKNGSGKYDIFANRYNGSWGTAVYIETSSGNSAAPQIAIDSLGNAIAIWAQYNSALTRWDINANRYTVGSGWGTATPIHSYGVSGGGAGIPQIAFNALGDAIVVWSQAVGDYSIWSNMYHH